MDTIPGPRADSTPVHDTQTARPDGSLVGPEIDGLIVRELVTIPDDRGEVCELIRADWGLPGDPPPHAYLATLLPGVVKGWVRHHHQADRVAAIFGRLHWAWYDDRPGSPTHGVVTDRVFTDRRRGLVVIPPGVWHAVKNVGLTEAAFVNLPTRQYAYDAPDKERLPVDSPAIPFQFADR